MERGRAAPRVEVDTLAYPPGGGWTYSNVGYLLVRRAIEAAFGADLEAALQALVFAPLGVRGVHIAREPGDISRGAFGNPRNYHPGWVYHGLLMGPPREAARWMHGLMTGRLLSPRLLDMMLERRALDVPLTGRPWKTAGYGLGVMMDVETALGRCFGHSGEGHGSVCAVYHFPTAIRRAPSRPSRRTRTKARSRARCLRPPLLVRLERAVEVERLFRLHILMHHRADRRDHRLGRVGLEDVAAHVDAGRALLDGVVGHRQRLELR